MKIVDLKVIRTIEKIMMTLMESFSIYCIFVDIDVLICFVYLFCFLKIFSSNRLLQLFIKRCRNPFFTSLELIMISYVTFYWTYWKYWSFKIVNYNDLGFRCILKYIAHHDQTNLFRSRCIQNIRVQTSSRFSYCVFIHKTLSLT